jgi:hypothetical protein
MPSSIPFQSTFTLRNPDSESEGSTFLTPLDAEDLLKASWEEYGHPAIVLPAIGFSANIPGTMGIVSLEKLPHETPCEMRQEHKGEFPFVSPVVARRHIQEKIQTVDFTVILLGPCSQPRHSDRIVFTFHPGPPMSPSTMRSDSKTAAVRTTHDAMQLGFLYAKVVTR